MLPLCTRKWPGTSRITIEFITAGIESRMARKVRPKSRQDVNTLLHDTLVQDLRNINKYGLQQA